MLASTGLLRRRTPLQLNGNGIVRQEGRSAKHLCRICAILVSHAYGRKSPDPVAVIVDEVLLDLCAEEEENRIVALQAVLDLQQHIDRARKIRVTKDYTRELYEMTKSRIPLCA